MMLSSFFKVFLLLFLTIEICAKEKLVIISPHRKSIQKEFVPAFKNFYKSRYQKVIDVEWIDQGGSENDLRFIINRYKNHQKSSQIDIFWGGGDITFHDLESRKLLESYALPQEIDEKIPSYIGKLKLKSTNNYWFATAISSFGIFYNKRILNLLKLDKPRKWDDLARKEYFNYISVADPRHSSSSLVMNIIMLKTLGWEKGWALLNTLAANTKSYTHSSSDPIKAVVSGDVAIATAIDFYAKSKVSTLGQNNLGFSLPVNQSIFNSDPIAILKGSPNKINAQRFINFILSEKAQKILIFPKGHRFGPKYSTLARMSVVPNVYSGVKNNEFITENPFSIKPSSVNFDVKEVAKVKKIISDLIGTIHVDLHKDLKKTWLKIMNLPDDSKQKIKFLSPPFDEKTLDEHLKNWDNNIYRSKTINSWISLYQKKYELLSQISS